MPSYYDALTDHWQPVAPARVILAASKLSRPLQIDCGLWVTGNIICLYARFIDSRLKLLIDLLKISECYRIGRLFDRYYRLSDFHTVIPTLSGSCRNDNL